MIRIENVSRREFLKGVAGAGAFVLGVSVLPRRLFAENRIVGGFDPLEPMSNAALQPSVYLAIDTDGTTYVVAHRSEMGNGVRASLPRIVADELDADWARVKVVQATGDEKYGDQDTDGSHSVVSFFIPLRVAGATARLMLVRAAAQQWNVPVAECSTELHTVVHKTSGKKLGYGELATAASKLDVPKKEELQLKAPSEWRYIGKDAPIYDLKDLVTGKGMYGQDTRHGRNAVCRVMHPPVLGSTAPKSVDDKAALDVPGVKQTATIDTFKPPILFQALGGVAVIADNTWAAMQGKKKLKDGMGEEVRTTLTTPIRTKRNCRKPRASRERSCAKLATWMQRSRRAEKSSKPNTTRRYWRTHRWSHPRRWRFTATEKWRPGLPRRVRRVREMPLLKRWD